MNRMVNYIWLACLLRTYNLMDGFSKYELDNKLLGGVTLLRITPGVA